MSKDKHTFEIQTKWTGNIGQGTTHYTAYERSHEITATGRPAIPGSSDPTFRGDRTRYNPEQLLVASLSACHLLWYLHLCAEAGVVVVDYVDEASGEMIVRPDGGGNFTRVVLRPAVTVTEGSGQHKARELHQRAHHLCFIANSVNFPVDVIPTIAVFANS